MFKTERAGSTGSIVFQWIVVCDPLNIFENHKLWEEISGLCYVGSKTSRLQQNPFWLYSLWKAPLKSIHLYQPLI